MCFHLNPCSLSLLNTLQVTLQYPTISIFFHSDLVIYLIPLTSDPEHDHRSLRIPARRDRVICRETHQVVEPLECRPHSPANPNSFHTLAPFPHTTTLYHWSLEQQSDHLKINYDHLTTGGPSNPWVLMIKLIFCGKRQAKWPLNPLPFATSSNSFTTVKARKQAKNKPCLELLFADLMLFLSQH